ncbi:tRNA(fMet)-specific endonuclease VapC [Psychroflexus salarius]|uniref:tRNA(fMet)-specific endonuclease VapC n=1 Tax=Psychroflexus salarius TaxID=1155689 RepID=A0A1M4TUB7_9FLAO|nr:type II toxin-antitoxin system VapC family toxin [Psychroflexus salarius]SHE48018.1 tRNA(fMet)-specific endonuclease VapC [Psychroflexus salarius]
MKYLIDTNVCIHFFRGKFSLIDSFETVKLSNCAVSEITLAELIFGAENSSNPKKNYKLIDKFTERTKILPIYNAIGIYAKEKVRLRKKGEMISDFDLLIGSTAISNDLIMVTENVKEFKRINGIRIENWVNR